MALTVIELAAALRLGDGVEAPTEPLSGILTRLLGVAEATANIYAPGAPETVRDEAAIRFSAYLYDLPDSQRGSGYAAAWVNSGAGALVSPWRVHRIEGSPATPDGAGVS